AARKRVGVTAEFGGRMGVAWHAGASTAKDDAGAEGQALGGGAGVDDLMQVHRFFRREAEARSFPGHRITSVWGGMPAMGNSEGCSPGPGNTKRSIVHARSG